MNKKNQYSPTNLVDLFSFLFYYFLYFFSRTTHPDF